MEFVAPVIDSVVGFLYTRITKELGYWVSSRKNVEAMNEEMTRLKASADIIEKQKEDINDVKGIQSSADVLIWLKQFEDIRKEAATVPTDGIGIGCFNIKMRYKAGKQSSDILEKINKRRLKDIPRYQAIGEDILAKVPSNYQASTSGTADDGTQNNFETRDVIFKKALGCLESKSSKTQMIALCGMGGVGKSHMMKGLKKKVEESRLFYWVVKVVVGQNTDLNALQHALAEKTGGALKETTSDARAERLKNRFAEMSKDGEKKILVILDDLWEEVNLQYIGLTSPLPNGYKLLITSRKANVCTKMGVDTDAILNIGALSDGEAITMFFDEAQILRDNDPNLDRIVDEIIKRCGKLPIALKLIASTLRGKPKKEAACKVALLRLQRHELKGHYEIVHKAFEISYNDLKTKEEKAVFLLSGLFPDDFDIPVEELIRFGWGLKLFAEVFTFAEARLQVEIWVETLISANLLAKSDRAGCVNMHDLARTFALSDSIEVKQASIVNNHDILKQRRQPKSFQRILLKWSGMSEFPKDFDYSDLAFLKLMDGDEQLKFPDDFCKSTEKLQVLSYEGIQHPLLPKSTNLTTLCLHGCKFTYDWSAIKNLVQLEVLSFAGSGITELPCEVGELKNLKLLDLTGCSAQLCIDDGVLEGLLSLEELYIKASGQKAIRFTKDICEELKVLSAKLSALQFEFFDKETLPENMSFTKLERFKISMGCLLEEDKDIYSFKNTLKLVTSSSELNRQKINELFEKTEKLHLQVKDMKNLKDVIFYPSQPCFSKLTELEVSACEELTFLFPADVAMAFRTLERLTVSNCDLLKTLTSDESRNRGSVIKFLKLKFLSLKELPRLMSLCDTETKVEMQQLVELILEGLPELTSIYPDDEKQSFFNPQVEIPMLEKLKIYSMKNLKQIWPSQISTGNNNNVVRVVKVKGCDSLINLFPTNPMPLLNKLEKLQAKECGSINVLFNIDLEPSHDNGLSHQKTWDWSVENPVGLVIPPEEHTNSGCVGKFEEVSCSLRSIRVEKLKKLEVLWRTNGANNSPLLSCFQSVEDIHIHGCKRFSNISTPSIPNFPPRAHVDIRIQDSRDLVFNKALKSLEPDSKTTKMALCGVGNVGKTTLMEDLVEAVKDLRMFHSIVLLVSGRESDVFNLQETTAKGIGEVLKGKAIEERAKFLGQKFMQRSQGVKSKILVILDDLREVMDLKLIGLSDSLPNGIKLLITTRDKNVCTQMGVEKSSIFRVPLLGRPEAKVLFYQTLRPSDGGAAAVELNEIAEEVVKICCGMPFLIKEIASLLENQKRSTWKDAYLNLKQNQLNSIYQKWYEQLETEDAKVILLLSGFFPEGADIPVEDLLRYGWGLKLFNDEVDTLAEARQQITNSVDVLIRANMFIRSEHVRCVKMRHPLRGFVFSTLTKVKQVLIEHDNVPKDLEEPYERILLNCSGMTELPVGFNYKNVRLLKLMGEEERLKFPHDFYDRMKELQVVAYQRIDDPLLPQYSTNLRTLCLDSCSLMGDLAFLGNLTNLEILSFLACGIQTLPSTIGNLKRLKVLDVTECSADLSIDEGVFRNLDKLEELYLRVHGIVRLVYTNTTEFRIRSHQLSALEVELSENMLQPLLFEKLKRFNISMGCQLDDTNIDPSKNTLNLGSYHNELLQSRIVELLTKKTDRLCLQVKDMKNLEQVSIKCSFCNLKEFEISECADLMFLFTVPVARGLRKLERLKVSSCPVLETLIHGESGGRIVFPKLQSVSLKQLPCLMNLCDTENRVELQQLVELRLDGIPNITTIFPDGAMQPNAFFNKQVVIPKLETLKISSMQKLKQIWPSKITTTISEEEVNDISMVRVVEVQGCNGLVNLFPTNPMPLLLNLEKLQVKNCGSIKVLFNIDLGLGGEIEQVSSLRSIQAVNLKKLEQVWRIKGANNSHPISGFQAVTYICILECLRFKDIFTPKSINFDMRAVVDIKIQNSRDFIFKEALKSLKSNNKTNMIALVGMGGVGKTHMMERLKKAMEDSRMFYCVVKVAVGQKADPIALQHLVAEKTGGSLTKSTRNARAELLKKRFQEMSQGGEHKILVILDDVWIPIDLKDIGLPSPLPNGFKLLMTSRNQGACMRIGVPADSFFHIKLFNDVEAKTLFFETLGISENDDPDLYKIGEDIIRRCVNLPIALKTIASTLKGRNLDEADWTEVLSRLQNPDLDDTLSETFKISYDHLRDDEKAVFLLSSLFLDDFDIPVEELMRYGWGLKLFPYTTLASARLRVETCIKSLISANLLAESHQVGCVTMHDLLRYYALSYVTEFKQVSLDNHDDIMWQLTKEANKSYQRVLLKCNGMTEFPKDLIWSNLAFLKLMGGDEKLKFPEDFYNSMEKLQVLSHEEMLYPLLPPRSSQCSAHLRTLCLHGCKLKFDFSAIGDLASLEVLSFAHSGIKILPSFIRKLKKLMLLDLTGCLDLQIEDGVFQGLDKLDELYMRVSGQKAIRFTDANLAELEKLSVKLSALEVEFFGSEALAKNMSFIKLERFKISIGCLLEDDKDIYSFKNTLKLNTSRSELEGWKINELFGKTEELHLEVKDMKHLTDVITMHPYQYSFSKLRVLVVRKCEDLRYLFTVAMASGLRRLKSLEVSKCPNMESLIHGDESENDGVIIFEELKFLTLKELPRLMSLCYMDNRVVLPQLVQLTLNGLPNFTTIFPDDAMQPYAFFTKQVYIPNLEELRIRSMEKLTQIWPCEEEVNDNVSMLRDIEVSGCESLENLFPCNPLPLLNHLDFVYVKDCCSVEVLFNMDLRGAGAGNIIEQTSSLRQIVLGRLEKLREIWRIKGGDGNTINNSSSSSSSPLLISCFQAVEEIHISDCKRFTDIFSPRSINFDTIAEVHIDEGLIDD